MQRIKGVDTIAPYICVYVLKGDGGRGLFNISVKQAGKRKIYSLH